MISSLEKAKQDRLAKLLHDHPGHIAVLLASLKQTGVDTLLDLWDAVIPVVLSIENYTEASKYVETIEALLDRDDFPIEYALKSFDAIIRASEHLTQARIIVEGLVLHHNFPKTQVRLLERTIKEFPGPHPLIQIVAVNPIVSIEFVIAQANQGSIDCAIAAMRRSEETIAYARALIGDQVGDKLPTAWIYKIMGWEWAAQLA